MVNKVILVGNVGGDPEVRHIDENTQFARFTLATTERYRNRQGEQVSQTEWHNIVVWRGLAKVVEQYVRKGSQLYIEGRITNRSYEKDGQTRYFTEIVANSLKMLGRRGDNAGNGMVNMTTYNNVAAQMPVAQQPMPTYTQQPIQTPAPSPVPPVNGVPNNAPASPFTNPNPYPPAGFDMAESDDDLPF